jgi:UDP-N-acetylmuramate--L-alanine ligase
MKRIYFVGIGGVGMSAVAGLAAAREWNVRGSDVSEVYEPALGVLARYQIAWTAGYAEENIQGCFDGANPDIVVASAAITESNPEIAYAKAHNIPVIPFPEALNEISEGLRQIVITGTHGKSTTSGLVGHALKALHDSSFMVGAVLTDYSSNFYAGSGTDIVIEGDEYFASDTDRRPKFMLYNPDVLLVNNIEFDHPDAFASIDEVLAAFAARIQAMPEGSVIVYNADDAFVQQVITGASVRTIGFGFQTGDIQAQKPQLLESGMFEIAVTLPDGKQLSIQSLFPGMSYAYDFLAGFAAVLAAYPHTDPELLQEVFAHYHGVKRRFEVISHDPRGPVIIDDYAHHPTAVRQTLEAARMKYPDRRIVCFFEPHTYSRTKETLPQLANAFDAADVAYIAEIYPAREQRLPSSITGREVVAKVQKHSPHVQYIANKQDALDAYLKITEPNDVVLVMAVGAFNRLAYELKDALTTSDNGILT